GSLIVGGALAVSVVGIAAEVADAIGFREQRGQLQQRTPTLSNAEALALQIAAKGGLAALDLRTRTGVVQQFINANTTYQQALLAAQEKQNQTSLASLEEQKKAQQGMGALGNAMHEQNLGLNVA